jgi:phosphatidylinositol-3-phosphatase
MRKIILLMLSLYLISCSAPGQKTPDPQPDHTSIPAFRHVVWIVLENRNFGDVIGNPEMPYFNHLAKDYVLLDQYYSIQHPSLPNYIALISGGAQGITGDCIDCFVNQPNLADIIEAGGRTWKTYQEDMPGACFIGNKGQYVQRHNPFIYFDSIRLDPNRCQRSIIPFDDLQKDLAENQFPDFAFISPNLCHSGHDCDSAVVDQWVKQVVELLEKSPEIKNDSLIVITYDEAKIKDEASCCGLGGRAGGRVAAVLISSLAKPGFVDSTPLSHYSLLKTILLGWQLPELGVTGSAKIDPITRPWN